MGKVRYHGLRAATRLKSSLKLAHDVAKALKTTIPDKGIATILGAIVFGVLGIFIIGILLYPGLWIYGTHDGYKTAETYNRTMGLRPG